MVYVMSDLHGMYEKYKEMLDKIHFTKVDTLFILGDVCDRGEKPMEILVDMMQRPNVYPVMGNHDNIALSLLRYLNVEITEKNCDSYLNEEIMETLMLWQTEGGGKTMKSFRKLSDELKNDVLDYLESFPNYETIDVYDRTYIMTHAGLGNYRPDKKLSEYTEQELLETRDILRGAPFGEEKVYLITGHTPTFVYSGKPEIIREGHQIMIDCGAVFEGGRLACLCLDTGEEFYV